MLSTRSTDARSRPKTPGRENSIHRPTTGKAEKKGTTAAQKANTKSLVHEVARPIALLTDKTPLPNRFHGQSTGTTIGAAKGKIPNTPLTDDHRLSELLREANKTNALFGEIVDLDSGSEEPNTGSVARASSSRVYSRAPRLSALSVDIATPQGKDESSSFHPNLNDDDEIEYMPPKSVEKYTPPFDFVLPDYTAAGKAIRETAYSFRYEDDLPVVEIQPVVELGSWDMLVLPALREELEELFSVEHRPAPTATESKKPKARPGTSLSRPILAKGSKPEAADERQRQRPTGKVAPRQSTISQRPATAIGTYGKAIPAKLSTTVGYSSAIHGEQPVDFDDFLFDV
ncbi:hypothetical protein C8F01DRAFT_1180403 [Mycena amicta]|nr:hypothetical protein C8F01DRAFT_1180403 [Mycena amicta]